MAEPAIIELWSYINEVLEFEQISFSIQLLSGRQWYLQVLSVLFPFLDQEWNKIAGEVHSEEAAIDRMLLLLAQQGALPEEYLAQIKGKNIVNGNEETIKTLVQILNQFVEQALEQGQEGEGQPHQSPQNQQELAESQSADYIHRTQEQPLVRNKSPMVTIKDSEVDHHERNVNSVLGIGHQFEQDEPSQEQYEQPDFDKVPKGFNIHGGTMQTGSSSQPKFMKMTNYKSQEEDEEPNDIYEDDNYLHQKLNKCKSQEQFKNIQKPKNNKGKKGKKVRILVPHPPIVKQYNKARTPAQKQLTKTVKSVISGSRKVLDKQNFNMTSPAGKSYIDKKKREANYFTSPKNQYNPRKSNAQMQSTTNLNINKLKKLLKWKENNLKKQQKEIQQDLEMKVQLKKETYVKKINKLIINLEKEKIIESKKEERERQKRQKQMAEKRFMAIEQQYRDQMALLNSRNSAVKKLVGHTDHRTIIENLEKQLKKQNEKQINNLKTKLKRQQAQLDDDLQVLQREIIKAYKRN